MLTTTQNKTASDGSTAKYYELPPGATTVNKLCEHKDMNAHIADIFKLCMQYHIKNVGFVAPNVFEFSELQHIISHYNMNAQIGEIYRACYRYGEVAHSERLRDAKKIKFYIEAEQNRLEWYDYMAPNYRVQRNLLASMLRSAKQEIFRMEKNEDHSSR